LEIGSQKTKVERLRRSLNGATSAAQVTAFEHEIGFATAAIAKLEDEEIASMERTETLEGQLREVEAKLKTAQEQREAERARAARVKSENEAAIAGIEVQRKELRAQIDEDRLATYDRLRKTKGTALAEALGNATVGKCSACQMGVRPQRWQDLIGRDHEDEIFMCETCGRMLFWDPRRDTPKPWAAGDKLRGAQAGSAR
jgi:predicted  nucleic acid-binding Zn-ribbon protein